MISFRARQCMTILATLIAVLGTLGSRPAFANADTPAELTLPQFRAQAQAQNPRESPQGVSERAVQSFKRLFAAQGREEAARQSLDRLSGWVKAAQTRWETQSVPALDVEMLQFAESGLVAELARWQTERRQAVREANSLLRRSPEAPLLALPQELPQAPSNPGSNPGEQIAPGTSAASQPTGSPNAPSAPLAYRAQLERLEKELLPRGRELLAKMFQSYLFGGVTVEALLWQEQQVYRTEVKYQLLLAEAEIELASGLGAP